jgi:signal transduction histidine kinase
MKPMNTVSAGWLQSIDALKDVPAGQLQWLIDNSVQEHIPAGEYLFRTNDPITSTIFIISGRVRAYRMQQQEAREIAVFEPKNITGYLPYSRGNVAIASGQAMEDTEVLRFPREKSGELIREHFELTQALVHQMTNRVREFTSNQLQNEKMAALGKLSAGLAHELNNPASAVVRGAAALREHLHLVPEYFKKVSSLQIPEAGVDAVSGILFELLRRPRSAPLPLMQRTEREDELAALLESWQVENAAEIAENMVDFGGATSDLEAFRAHIPPNGLSAVINWINSNLVTEKMVADIGEASRRIATLIGSVKVFTHMDQGHDQQTADIHEGIHNTLTMLQYKTRKGNVQVVQHFNTGLPPVKAYIGELNQVWTNLIDNALDAMAAAGSGTLDITTEKDGPCVKVTITDNGPGIPADILPQIFDPFFTTKEVGKGTGLGLDIVSQIVRQHKGNIKVQSEPGRTQFSVSLPVNA